MHIHLVVGEDVVAAQDLSLVFGVHSSIMGEIRVVVVGYAVFVVDDGERRRWE